MGKNIKFNLKIKMIILISLLIIGIFIIFGLFLRSFLSTTMEDQIGKRALSVAQSVANMPELREAFHLEAPATLIQEMVTPIQQDTGAEFIVVGNKEGIRYSHPEPDHLGKKMVGGDNRRALVKGESYVSKRTGSLGLSIRGKVPIYDENNTVIGLVSVGFLNEEVQGIIKSQSKSVWATLFGIVLLGIIGAILISHYIKKLLSDMEPEEISQLVLQKEAILQSTHEGIIAVDDKGLITMINTAAQEILFFHKTVANEFIGKSIKELLPHTDIFHVLTDGGSHYNREMILGENIVLVNRTPIHSKEAIIGAVSTFRKKQRLNTLRKNYCKLNNMPTHNAHKHMNFLINFILYLVCCSWRKVRKRLILLKKRRIYSRNGIVIFLNI